MVKRDYEVGYGKPPRKHQFRPGQSGNPKGRPKGAQNLATDLKEELEEQIVVSEGGKSRTMSKQRALVKALLAKALKGETRAAQALIALKLAVDQATGAQPEEEVLLEEEREIIDRFTARLRGRSPAEKEP
jgi:hypothetical protein